MNSATPLYDGRPDLAALAKRLAKDKVVGDVSLIVVRQRSTMGNEYDLVVIGVFSEGVLKAQYQTRRDKKIQRMHLTTYRHAESNDFERLDKPN